MPPGLKIKPKPVARRRAAAQAEAAGDPSEPSSGTVTPAVVEYGSSQPAPTAPIAPPPGRLDSLLPPPAPPRPPLSGSIRGSSSLLKFKPKLVARKTKEERDAIAAKLEASATPIPYDYQFRGGRGGRGFRGGRGRGGRHDDDRFSRPAPATASGPFSLGSVETGRRKLGAVERGSNFTKHRQSLPSSEVQTGKKPRMKSEDGAEAHYSSSEDSDDSRMDIEFIGYLDERVKIEDEGGEQNIDEDSIPWGAGAPLRVPRSQHVELKSSVNTDSSLKANKGIKKGKSKADFQSTVKIKDEPAEEDMGNNLRDLPPVSGSQKVKTEFLEGLGQQFKEECELEEQDRLTTLREMIGDFSGLKTDEDDIEMKCGIKSPTKSGNIEIDNQIFCFQFPEILPQLISPIKAEIKTEVKTEPGVPPPPTVPLSLKQQTLSTKAQLALLESFPPSGIAGKLRVHKSGRVTILWGSGTENESPIEFCVSRGSTMGFLQEAVIIKKNSPWGEQDVDDKGKQKGAAFSLGQIKGKFVVSPDFKKLIGVEEPKRKDKGKGKMVDMAQKF